MLIRCLIFFLFSEQSNHVPSNFLPPQKMDISSCSVPSDQTVPIPECTGTKNLAGFTLGNLSRAREAVS